ncbi:hypothetical protein [Roseobacter litoralis]|uniref:hypothetical protein n=1 Tax=Roseobacter litoralis TaxID=42443 RepID=UPI0024954E19|nr:hypothetical protein [Roseobacter litoralis]
MKAAEQAKAAKEAADKAPKEPAVSFGEASDTALQELIKGQNHGDLFKTVDSVLLYGEIPVSTLERMASMASVEAHEMEAQIGTVWAGAQEATADFFHDAGVQNEEAFPSAGGARSPHRHLSVMGQAAFQMHLHLGKSHVSRLFSMTLAQWRQTIGSRLVEPHRRTEFASYFLPLTLDDLRKVERLRALRG